LSLFTCRVTGLAIYIPAFNTQKTKYHELHFTAFRFTFQEHNVAFEYLYAESLKKGIWKHITSLRKNLAKKRPHHHQEEPKPSD
jgi:hypothetical protein